MPSSESFGSILILPPEIIRELLMISSCDNNIVGKLINLNSIFSSILSEKDIDMLLDIHTKLIKNSYFNTTELFHVLPNYQLHGSCYQFKYNKLYCISNYYRGDPHKAWTYYHINDGSIWKICHYYRGEKTGLWRYWHHGIKYYECNYTKI